MNFAVTWSKPMKFENGNFNVTGKGVYVIGYLDTATKKRHILYVGQGDIDKRLADHFQNNERIWQRLLPDGRVPYYRCAVGGSEADRLDVEFALYSKYGGKNLCNEVEPPGSGRFETVTVQDTFQ